ncbi:hypothetical protein [Candidatus Palauibacter sp.]|uniref:hypothetical protein n=1 Tax=Candidatus Palauibacter sp. TaxID=3101350 RepID=UPI003B025894
MGAANIAVRFEELGQGMDEQVTSLRAAGFRVTLRRDDLNGLVAGQFAVQRDVTGSLLFRATLTLEGTLDVRLGSPADDAPVRRYLASETDYVWQPQPDEGDAGPFTSRALAAAWGEELLELLRGLNPPTASPYGSIVTKE